jgi:transcriptional regulator with XRE-family HTH domain
MKSSDLTKPSSNGTNGSRGAIRPDHGGVMLSVADTSSVDASIEAKAIGQRIRKLRLKRSMGLVEFGKRTGLSASFLSQLETGRVVPTLKNLARICMVFEKDISYFFREDSSNCFRISDGKSRVRLIRGNKHSPTLIAESLSALIPDRSIVPCLAEFLPGPDVEPFHAQKSPGVEFVYVIEGVVDISVEAGKHQLEIGDIAWIDANTSRQYQCGGDVPAKTMIVTFPGVIASHM